MYKGNTIQPGTNLFKELWMSEETIFPAYGEEAPTGQLIFKKSFNENSEFEEGKYLVTFSCRTSDKKTFSRTVEVEFKINN